MIEIPRQLSTKGEHGFRRAGALGPRLLIMVDGDPLRRVVAYDIDGGWADVHETDDAGKVMIARGAVVIRRVHGKVEVRLK